MKAHWKKSLLLLSLMAFLCVSGNVWAVATTVYVESLQPSWTAPGGGGVWAEYWGPLNTDIEVSPGYTAVYDGRQAGIIKAGYTSDGIPNWDQGLFAFKVNANVSLFASQALSYDVQNQTGANPVWVRIRLVGGTQYQFVPTTNPASWHTVNAAAGQWQLMDDNGNATGPMMTLAQVATANPGATVDRVYLTLGEGASYYVSPGVGTVAWVDTVTIGDVTYDFVLKHLYVTKTGSDTNDCLTVDTACLTITHAIQAADPYDTITVAAGIYSEKSILVNKSLTILGNPGNSAAGPAAGAPIIDGGGVVADAFDLANGVSNVTIRGFEIRNFLASGFTDGSGVGVQAWVPSTSNITVSNNWFHNVGYGVMAGNDGSETAYALGTHTNWNVSNNVIENFSSIGVELTDTSNSSIQGNVIHMAGGSATGQIGIFSWAHISQSGLTVSGNTIDGAMVAYPTVYMYGYDDVAPSPNLNNVTITNNTISTTGTPFQVYMRNINGGTITGVHVNNNDLTSLKNLTAVSIDGTNNWWGRDTGPGAGKVSGTVLSDPWLVKPIGGYHYLMANYGPSGLWRFNGVSAWTQVTTKNVGAMAYYFDGTNERIYAGDSTGLWSYAMPSTATPLGGAVPENLMAFNGVLLINYGAKYGLFKYDGTTGTQIGGADPSVMCNVGPYALIGYTKYGLFKWDGTNAATLLAGATPEKIIKFGSGALLAYAKYGLFKYDATGGTQLDTAAPGAMCAVGSYALIDLAGKGLYKYDGTNLTPLGGAHPENIVALSGNVALIDYGTKYGVFKYDGNTATPIGGADPAIMVQVNSQVYLDYDAYGLFKYDGTTATSISKPSGVVADQMLDAFK